MNIFPCSNDAPLGTLLAPLDVCTTAPILRSIRSPAPRGALSGSSVDFLWTYALAISPKANGASRNRTGDLLLASWAEALAGSRHRASVADPTGITGGGGTLWWWFVFRLYLVPTWSQARCIEVVGRLLRIGSGASGQRGRTVAARPDQASADGRRRRPLIVAMR